MNISHPELQQLFDTILSESTKTAITAFIDEIEQFDDQYNCEKLWIADQAIGGIGGYCMPANPVKNPYPGGPERALYRPLQYARSEIEICDVRLHARYAVQMCGMHLESVCRLYLKSRKSLGPLRFGNTTLGKAIQQIQAINEIDPNVINGLFAYVKVYNRSKHEINQDDSRERLFNAYDAITGYFSARVLGLNILKALNICESFDCYETVK